MKVEYSATLASNITSITISQSHGSSTATAIIDCQYYVGDIGSSIDVYIGYDGSTIKVFSGYVKQIDKNSPGLQTVTATDKMVRAVDYFIASDTPEDPLSYKGISAEDLVKDLMSKASLNDFTYDATYFTFGINNSFEVNLVSAYDYARNVADTLTWHLWCDEDGVVHFENRKPYVMTGNTGQPGDDTDETPESYAYATIDTSNGDGLSVSYTVSEKDLRNRVIVYGDTGISGEAEASSPYLPAGYYKTIVAGVGSLIDSNDVAQKTAEYNLALYNRLSYGLHISVIGNPLLKARKIIRVKCPQLSIDSNWYIYTCEHSVTSDGYICNLELKQ